jgi:molecular chaperone DnaK
VSFDIDANGILNVSARDKDTGKEQKITISGSTNLDKSEIDRMVHHAETHARDDQERRELVEERNQADSLAYQVEKAIQDLGDKVPTHEKARCEQLIGEIRSAMKEDTPIERIRQLKSDLQQASYNISQAAYQRAQGGAPEGAPGGGNGRGSGNGTGVNGGPRSNDSQGSENEDYIDAEYTEM